MTAPEESSGVRRSVTVGIVGGGQLGRMMALAGIPLGLRFRFLEPGEDPPCGVVGEVVRGAYDDPEALDRFADGVDVITYEFENVPVDAAQRLAERVSVYPPPMALEVAQDRWVEKETFRELGLPTVPYRKVDTRQELDEALAELGTPAVLKTRRMGYDGKGQAILDTPDSVDEAWKRFGDRPLILEGFVDFRRELSCLAARGRSGELRIYPLVENLHHDGILRESRAPAPSLTPERVREASTLVERLLGHLNYVGVLAVEFFETDKGLLANEMAPRVHNSGHWSQDGGGVSQFENHLRAILGLPLGEPRPSGWAGMVNLIGGIPPRGESLGASGARLHLYGKDARPARKLGHLNVRDDSLEGLERRMQALTELAARYGDG